MMLLFIFFPIVLLQASAWALNASYSPFVMPTNLSTLSTSRRRLIADGGIVANIHREVEVLKKEFESLYGGSTAKIASTMGVKWYNGDAKDERIVDRLLRAMLLRRKFVVVVGGMSDTAGHGNLASEAYPMVMLRALRPVFAAANIELEVRNFAMGGVPSFPSSVCMKEVFGDDVDLVVWDFRMVERDEIKGELYIRHALLLNAIVMFKRNLPYLNKLSGKYAQSAGLHVIDENPLIERLKSGGSKGISDDTFCETKCSCPGQVRWHSGWKIHRLRGLHMAMVYAESLLRALDKYEGLLARGSDPVRSRNWDEAMRIKGPMPPPTHRDIKPTFGSYSFQCATTWNPTHGRSLTNIIDTSNEAKGGTQWKTVDPNSKVSMQGKACGYSDNKAQVLGGVRDGWIFFSLPQVSMEASAIGLCFDIPKGVDFKSMAFIAILNGEEIQDSLEFWQESRTLGVSLKCYGTTKFLHSGMNSLGLRVMEDGTVIKLSHVIWR